MKKIVFGIFLLFAISVQAQLLQPVKWTTQVIPVSENEFTLQLTATIDTGWHLFSQNTPQGGSLPTEFSWNNQKNYKTIGKTTESAYKKVYNDVFEVDEYIFEKKAVFQQKIKRTNTQLQQVKVAVSYQVCKEQCIQQDETFTFQLPAATTPAAAEATDTDQADRGTIQIETKNKEAGKPMVVIRKEPATNDTTNNGLGSLFLLSFLGGLAALLTPCVFPMIPMTVSFFTKQSKNKAAGIKNALFYGISIIIIYVVLGTVVTAIFGADALNALSTNVVFNIVFFMLLVFFAASFLGAFELVLPNSWANKVDQQADRGGVVGILFMALALAIVSFSCTGPIVGTLLVQAASSGGIAPIVGMLGFSSALAFPFMFFALFPGWLQSLPKSGGWLNTVKVVLGFLELALALKFLSNADLVLQLHWLTREVFLAIWIAIFAILTLYLLGKIYFPHDQAQQPVSVGRVFLAIITATFTIYMIPGLWGAPLQLISGFPPPITYSEGKGNWGTQSGATAVALPEGAKEGPHQLVVFSDYQKGLAHAKATNKVVLLDFTGYACVNCRKMEDNVWSQPAVLKLLKEKTVLISLYVDDKRDLPTSEQYISATTGKEIVSIGNKWSDFQISKFKANAQPYYVALDHQEKAIGQPMGYTADAKEFEAWLQSVTQ